MSVSYPEINLIWAQTKNRVIGKENSLPWSVAEDMKHFTSLTRGHTVVMGRKTWDSLPPKFRPLPHRENRVITHEKDFVADGAVVFHDIYDALRNTSTSQVWVIGGGIIYQQALLHADRIHMTVLDLDIDGDAYAPDIGSRFKVVSRTKSQVLEKKSMKEIEMSFVTYELKK